MTHELKVEKRAQLVRIFMDDGSVVAATVFLPWGFEESISGQTVAEAVEDSAPALPCRGEDGAFMIMGTGSISGISVSQAEAWDEGFFDLHRARVTLRGGHEFDGFIRRDVGAGDRLSDAFRGVDEWIQIELDGEVVWFRVERLLSAVEVSEKPASDGTAA